GRVKNEQNSGLWWRKNVDNDDGCGSSYGVDLNRNSDFYWGWDDWGSSPYPCDETYRGPSPGSEPETAAFQDFAATVFQDWNGNNGDFDIVASPDNTSGIFLTLHSYADDILWPFGFNPGSAPNNDQLETIARKLADITGVMLPTGGIGYSVNGSSDDWIYGKLGIPAFTYEIGPNTGICGSFFPDYRCQDGLPGVTRNFWGELKESFVYINKIAATPYITAYGPDAQNLTAIPQVNPTLFDLAATVLDQRYSGDPLQHIMAAEYFIDAPGSDGLGFAMSPSDGSWGGTSEAVEAVVDASILDQGRHYLLVHGKNDDNVWGPYTAVFIEVSAPTYEVSLTPDNAHGQDDPGQMVTYQLQVNNIGHNSDTYNIDVDSLWSSTAPPNIGPLNPGESAVFDLQVTIPLSATHGETDFATITSSSQHNPDVSDSSLLITTANLYDLSLTPATGEGNGYPGGQAEYILQVTNTGNTTDTFDISASGVWSVTAPPVIDPLEAGGSADINVTVSVPPTAEAGDYDLSTITATSQGNSSMTHSSALTTHAVQVGPIVTPATVGGSGDPGSSVSYQLQLTNHNSLPDTFILTSNSSWSIHYPGTAGPIPAEGSTFIDVTVDIPADADGGVIDTAVITFTSSMPDLPIATATLSTRANDVFSFTVSPVEDSVTAYGTGITVQYTLQVTNNGNSADSYTFHVISSEWLVDVPVTIGPLAPGETTSVPVSVQVPLGISMGDSNNATITVISQHNFVGHQVYLHTDTFWYSFLIPLIQKH
ncbi:MAG TPA: M14 family zinc carboxypeptidase, partial [Anaerolineales bacterium]|nr:M14 family zinc carboxypeptidase [Anaerolineales bacterium]